MSWNADSQPHRRSSTYSIPRKPLRNASTSSSHIDLDALSISTTPTEYKQSILPSPFEYPQPQEREQLSNTPINPNHSSICIGGSDTANHKYTCWSDKIEEEDEASEPLHAGIDHGNIANRASAGSGSTEADKDHMEGVQTTIRKQESDGVSEDDLRLVPLSEKKIPDWRPNSLSWSPYLAILIVMILIVYACLYARSKIHGIITPVHSRYDWVFRFGPAFLAVMIQEIVLRIATDLNSVLPFIAAASRPLDRVRRQPFAHFTERRWYEGFHIDHLIQATTLLVRYCTFVLVPLQSSLLSTGSRHYNTQSQEFQVVDPDKLISSLKHSLVPALGFDSIWHGQPVSDIKWLSFMDSNVSEVDPIAITPDYAGIMPFVLKDKTDLPSEPDQSSNWKVKTSAIYGYFDCHQVDAINLTVGHIWLGTSGLQTDQISIHLQDRDGCVFEQSWANISSDSGPSADNPITWDGKFALWQILDGHQSNHSTDTTCLRYKHFIASGPLTVPYTVDEDQVANIAHTGPGSQWAAMSCTPKYRVLKDNITYSVDSDNQTVGEHAAVHFGDGDLLSLDDDRLNQPMALNFVQNGLVYNLSSPVFRRTFWNAPLPNAFGSLAAVYSDLYGDVDKEGCSDVTDKVNVWDNDNACQMYLNVQTLWPLLVAGTVSLSALYAHPEDQVTKTGEVMAFRMGWYLTGWELTYTTILHMALLWLITKESLLHLPDWLANLCCTSRWGKSKYRTGLYGTASCIAGLAFAFQDSSLQPLFERLDTMRPSLAVKESRRRFAGSELLLRKWKLASEEDSEDAKVSFAIIRPRNNKLGFCDEDDLSKGLKPEKGRVQRIMRRIRRRFHDLKCWQGSDRNARRLRYGRVPMILHPLLLISIFLSTMVIITIVYIYIVRSRSSGFQMWFQPTYALSQRSRDEVLRYLQKALFKGLPTLVLISIGFWWESVERYYRATQPYASLAHGAMGKDSICLDYIHSFHITTSYKALRNNHLLLAYVTFTTFAVKMGIVLTSGIFSMNEIGHKPGRDLPLSRNWRDGTFVDMVDDDFRRTLKRSALSRAVFGYPHTPGFIFEPWVFPSARFDGPQFQLNLTGIMGSLDCAPAVTGFSMDGSNNRSAFLIEGDCQGNIWNNVCLPPIDQGELNPADSSQACMAWRYIDEAECSKLSPGDGGRWWILGLKGTLDSQLPHNNSFASIAQNMSLLCRPAMYTSNKAISVIKDSNNEVWINKYNGAYAELPAGKWKGEKDSSLDFVTFSSRLLNDTFAGELYPATDDGWYDYFSVLTVLGSRDNKDRFFTNATAVASAASYTYSRVISSLISQNLISSGKGENATVLLQPIPEHSKTAPLVNVSPLANMATVARVPLYFATGILCIYCSAIICIWPRRKRRMPLDISYPANAMTMVYDSHLMEIIRTCGETKDFKALHKLEFAIGHYQGMSGQPRIGIDLKSRVTEIKGKDRFCGIC